MSTSQRRAVPRALLTGFLAGAAVVALAGCASTAAPAGSTSPTASVAAPSAPTPDGASTPNAGPTQAGPTPLDETCDDIMPTSVLDQYASGFALQAAYTPDPDSNAAQIVAEGGIACEWISTSGDHVLIAVGQPSHDALTRAETAAGGAGEPTTLFGPDLTAWAAKGGGTFPGQFDVFTPIGTWLSTTSSLYVDAESRAAKTFVQQVLQALPS